MRDGASLGLCTITALQVGLAQLVYVSMFVPPIEPDRTGDYQEKDVLVRESPHAQHVHLSYVDCFVRSKTASGRSTALIDPAVKTLVNAA